MSFQLLARIFHPHAVQKFRERRTVPLEAVSIEQTRQKRIFRSVTDNVMQNQMRAGVHPFHSGADENFMDFRRRKAVEYSGALPLPRAERRRIRIDFRFGRKQINRKLRILIFQTLDDVKRDPVIERIAVVSVAEPVAAVAVNFHIALNGTSADPKLGVAEVGTGLDIPGSARKNGKRGSVRKMKRSVQRNAVPAGLKHSFIGGTGLRKTQYFSNSFYLYLHFTRLSCIVESNYRKIRHENAKIKDRTLFFHNSFLSRNRTVLFAAASQPETTGVTRTRNDESRAETPPDAHRESH